MGASAATRKGRVTNANDREKERTNGVVEAVMGDGVILVVWPGCGVFGYLVVGMGEVGGDVDVDGCLLDC